VAVLVFRLTDRRPRLLVAGAPGAPAPATPTAASSIIASTVVSATPLVSPGVGAVLTLLSAVRVSRTRCRAMHRHMTTHPPGTLSNGWGRRMRLAGFRMARFVRPVVIMLQGPGGSAAMIVSQWLRPFLKGVQVRPRWRDP
jgi:hypothetical protein